VLDVPLEVFLRKGVEIDNQVMAKLTPNISVHRADFLSSTSSTAIREAPLPFSPKYWLYTNIPMLLFKSLARSCLSTKFLPSLKLATCIKPDDLHTSVLDYLQQRELYLFSRANKARGLQMNVMCLSAVYVYIFTNP